MGLPGWPGSRNRKAHLEGLQAVEPVNSERWVVFKLRYVHQIAGVRVAVWFGRKDIHAFLIKKIIVLAVEGAGFSIFPSILREDYVKWKASNPGVKARNDYASVGWGVLGLLTYLAIAAVIAAFRR
jgi:hypothetical protein